MTNVFSTIGLYIYYVVEFMNITCISMKNINFLDLLFFLLEKTLKHEMKYFTTDSSVDQDDEAMSHPTTLVLIQCMSCDIRARPNDKHSTS